MAELLRFPLASGIQEGADPKALPPGSLLSGVNIRQDKAGRARKRHGTELLGQNTSEGGVITAGLRLVSRTGKDVGFIDQRFLYERDAEGEWRKVDRVSPIEATWDTFDGSMISLGDGECAYDAATGLIASIWIGNGGYPIYAAHDAESGAASIPATLNPDANTGRRPRVIMLGAYAVFVYSTSTEIRVWVINLSTLTVSASINLAGGIPANTPIGICADGTYVYVAYEKTAAPNVLRVNRVNVVAGAPNLVSATDVNSGVTTNYRHICLDASVAENRLYIAYAADAVAPTGAVMSLNLTTMAVAVAATALNGGSPVSAVAVKLQNASNLVLAYGLLSYDPTGVSYTRTEVRDPASLALTASTARTSYNAEIASELWVTADERVFFLGRSMVAKQVPAEAGTRRKVILEVETGEATGATIRLAGVLSTDSGGTNTIVNGGAVATSYHTYLPAIRGDASGTFGYVLSPSLLDARVGFEARRQTLHRVRLDYRSMCAPLTLDRAALFANACVSVTDGSRCMPYGFVHEPMIRTLTAGAAGGFMATGTYLYAVHFEWSDAAGVVHRSIPHVGVSVAVTGPTGKVTLVIATTGLSSKLYDSGVLTVSPVRIVIYRTKAGEGTYYRLTDVFNDSTLSPFNSTSADFITVVDDYADTDIDPSTGTLSIALATQAQLYIEGGVAEQIAPPALIDACLHRSRILGIEGDRRTVWASSSIGEDPLVAGTFNELFTLWFDEDKYAIESLDSRFVVFGEDGIDVVDGDGPDITGGTRDWRVYRVQTDVGCTDRDSVVTTPAGVMFRSERGIMLLSRGLEVSWIGEPVQDILEAFPGTSSAVLVADQHEVRFTLTGGAGNTGCVLVFDYQRGAWYKRTYHDSVTSTSSVAFVDSKVIDGAWTALTAGGAVYVETEDHALDHADLFVEAEYVFAPISPAGPNGWSRCKAMMVLGTSLSNHDLEVSVARDYATSYEQTETFAAQGDTTTVGPLERARIDLANQKGTAFQFKVRDRTPTTGALGTGEGLQLEGIALLVQPKRGLPRTTDTRRG